mgnify:CR=1 FL=1
MPSVTIRNRRTGDARSIRVDGMSFTVGKSPENAVVLDQMEVSRRHCQFDLDGDTVTVTDLGSRNGTFVNGSRLSGAARLPRNQAVVIGEWQIQVDVPAAAPVSRSQAAETPTPVPPAAPAPKATVSTIEPPRQITPPALKKRIHQRILEEMDIKHTDTSSKSQDELYIHTAEVCRRIVDALRGELPAWLDPAKLVKEIVDEAVGLGPLEDLLADDTVSEIMVNNWDRIYVERNGRIQLSPMQFTENSQVVAIVRRILAPIGRRIDETTPMQDGRLPDGSRVNAIIPPLAISGPTLTIRKFSRERLVMNDLVTRFKSLTPAMGAFLELAVLNKMNILISGGTGSGKTTLLNCLSAFIPAHERIVTVEDAAELQLPQEHVVRLESRPPNLEGRNAIPIRELVRNSLRMRPDRIVVGECRGGEALDMLQAMNTGHDGSLTTLHANTPRDAIARLETLVLMAGMELPSRAIREQIASAVHMIVQISRLPDGSRKVMNITTVEGMEGDVVTLQDVFRFDQTGFDRDGRVTGGHVCTGMIPEFVQNLRRRGVAVDMSMFATEGGLGHV